MTRIGLERPEYFAPFAFGVPQYARPQIGGRLKARDAAQPVKQALLGFQRLTTFLALFEMRKKLFALDNIEAAINVPFQQLPVMNMGRLGITPACAAFSWRSLTHDPSQC